MDRRDLINGVLAAGAAAPIDRIAHVLGDTGHAGPIATRLMGAASADTWFGYCPQKHNVHRSQALTLLGDTVAARRASGRGSPCRSRPE
ncbi:MAG: hypothetical protein QOH97_5583 [Actinoplanes sp.]|nr:hypothetical protein [Actinoplanes sp.]